jgi:hypothetical protein
MKRGSITAIKNRKETEHAVEAPWCTSSEEIQEGAISSEYDGFIFLGIIRG